MYTTLYIHPIPVHCHWFSVLVAHAQVQHPAPHVINVQCLHCVAPQDPSASNLRRTHLRRGERSRNTGRIGCFTHWLVLKNVFYLWRLLRSIKHWESWPFFFGISALWIAFHTPLGSSIQWLPKHHLLRMDQHWIPTCNRSQQHLYGQDGKRRFIAFMACGKITCL